MRKCHRLIVELGVIFFHNVYVFFYVVVTFFKEQLLVETSRRNRESNKSLAYFYVLIHILSSSTDFMEKVFRHG